MRELDGLLDVSRIEAGRMPKEVTSFSVKGIGHGGSGDSGHAGGFGKGIAISWHITPDVPECVWSERRYLLKSSDEHRGERRQGSRRWVLCS